MKASSMETLQKKISARWMKCSGLLRLAMGGVLVIGLFGSITACGGNDVDPITFDPHKSKQLSQEQSNAYNVQLFNQLLVRGEPPLDKRYRLLKSMAEDGHELSYLALKLYDIRNTDLRRNDPQALQRIVDLADNGDAAAKCFYAGYFLPYDPSPDLKKKLVRYVEEAADGGIPRCMGILSGINTNHGDRWYWRYEAAARGDLAAQAVMALDYYNGTNGLPKDINRAACWLMEAEKKDTNTFGRRTRSVIDPGRKLNPDSNWCKSVVSKP